MKKKISTDHLILLEDSGELTDQQRRELEERLAADPAARARCDEVRRIAAVIPSPPCAPPADAAQRIANQLRQQSISRPSPLPRRASFLAAAAALSRLLALHFRGGLLPGATETARNSVQPGTSALANDFDAADDDAWQDPLEEDFAQLEELFASIELAFLTNYDF